MLGGTVGAVGSVDDAKAAAAFSGSIDDRFRAEPLIDQIDKDNHHKGGQQVAAGGPGKDHLSDNGDAADGIHADGPPLVLQIVAASLLFVDFIGELPFQQFLLGIVDFLREFVATDGGEQAGDTVEHAVGIVEIELSLMGPAVAEFSQFTDKRTFVMSQVLAKDGVPLVPHHGERGMGIPNEFLVVRSGLFAGTAKTGLGVALPLVMENHSEFRFRIGGQSPGQRIQRIAYVVPGHAGPFGQNGFLSARRGRNGGRIFRHVDRAGHLGACCLMLGENRLRDIRA